MMKQIYENAQLHEVSCCLIFPPILTIGEKQPTDFHEKIRSNYPYITQQETVQKKVDIYFNNGMSVPSVGEDARFRSYFIFDRHKKWRIVLSENSIALSTLDYKYWEDLYDRFSTPLRIFEEIYSPAFYDRIELRYVNIVDREALEIQTCKWKDLIHSGLSGPLQFVDESKMGNFTSDFQYALDEEHKYYSKVHAGFAQMNNKPEIKFVIDARYYSNTFTELHDRGRVLRNLYDYSHHFIHNMFSESLKKAMIPKEIDIDGSKFSQ